MKNYYYVLQVPNKEDLKDVFFKLRDLRIIELYGSNCEYQQFENIILIKATFCFTKLFEIFTKLFEILPKETYLCKITYHSYAEKIIYAGYDNSQDYLPLDYSSVQEKPSNLIKRIGSFMRLERDMSAKWLVRYLIEKNNDTFGDIPFRKLDLFYRKKHNEEFWFNDLDRYNFIIRTDDGTIKLTNGFYKVLMDKKFNKFSQTKKLVDFLTLPKDTNLIQYQSFIDQKDVPVFLKRLADNPQILEY